MPLVAQVTGAVALTALVMGPWWSRVDAPTTPLERAAAPAAPTTTAPVPAAPAAAAPAPAPAPVPAKPERPAHLNLDVRHSFANVNLIVTVDGKQALQTTLEGSGKKFKMFGPRDERGFTRTLDLQPGVRLVRVRIQSAEDRFDQTRVERFELASASVASLTITADKSAGIVAVADRPPLPEKPAPLQAHAPVSAPQTVAAAIPLPGPVSAVPAAQSITQQADALAELLNSLRSMLIAIAGFVASAATGFVVQEYLRSKKGTIFLDEGGQDADASRRRRRRRSGVTTPAVEP